ncbi:MAG: DUF1700 domain-containing protein [Defluviitaleaceae bacterium]|nr:DUF1700 domain-containing protein [Defluviitaleaceae bacterium]
MTKSEYLKQLDYRLRVLPAGERQDALDYYEGYLSDAEDEFIAIAQLGTPGEVAANILANYVAKTPHPESGHGTRKERTSGAKTAWMIILALFALPVGLPIIITLAGVSFSLFIALCAVIFSFAVTGVALIAGGIMSIVAFPFIVAESFGAAMLAGGTGLFTVGLGMLFISLTRITLRGFPMITSFVANKILRRNHHGR